MNRDRLYQTIEDFQNQNVLVIGDVMVDAYVLGKVDRISPEAPVPVVTVNERSNKLGGAANVAFNIKSLGANPILCSVIGKDVKGNEFLHLLEKEGLSSEGIIESNDRITTTKFRVIGNNVQILRVDEEDLSPINEDEEAQLIDRINEIVKNRKVRAIVFEDYDKGVINKKLIEFVSELGIQNKIYVSADPKRNQFHHYRSIDLLKPNLKELNEGMNLHLKNGDIPSIVSAAKQLLERQNLKEVMVTLSEHGVLCMDKDSSYHIPTRAKSIADVSGAGDTVISVLSLMRMSGASLHDAAFAANIAGGLVCEEVGVVPIQKDKLIQAYEK